MSSFGSKAAIAVSAVSSLVLGIVFGKSGTVDFILSEINKIHLPIITLPEGPFTKDVWLLLMLPATHYIAFAIGLMAFNAVGYWIGRAEAAKKLVIIDLIAIAWGILSYLLIGMGGK